MHQHILLLFHACFIQISSSLFLHMNSSYMFFIISMVNFWKYYVLLECIMNTLRKHWKSKSHLLKKPAGGAARIGRFKKVLIPSPR